MNENEMAFPKMENRKLVQIDKKNTENVNVKLNEEQKNTFKELNFRIRFPHSFFCFKIFFPWETPIELHYQARHNVKYVT